MRKFVLTGVLALLLIPGIGFAELPAKTGKNFTKTWQTYTRKLLFTVFPEKRRLIKRLEIKIVENEEPNAYAHGDSEAGKACIKINSGFIFAAEDESEYVYILAHEMEHIILRHRTQIWLRGWAGPIEDISYLEMRESEADICALEAVHRAGYDIRGAERVIWKLLDYYKILDDPEDPHNKICIKRYRVILEVASESRPQEK